MALPVIAKTHSSCEKPKLARLQVDVAPQTLRILKGAAALQDRTMGAMVDDLVLENLAQLIDVQALAEGQIINKDEETDAA
jgi:hypothetical protein